MATKISKARVTCCFAASLALLLSACSSGSSGLTTGSLLPSFKAAPPDEPTERALMVAATSARATRCGYNFDPDRLRASYLAHEASLGTPPAALAKAEQSYDYTRNAITKRTAETADFCDDEKTAEIKRELTRHLAGDFKLPVKRAAAPLSSSTNQPFDREKIFDPNAARR
jgi:hypothetical protein